MYDQVPSPQWGIQPPARPWRPRLKVVAAVAAAGFLVVTGGLLMEGPSFEERHRRDAEDHCSWTFNQVPLPPGEDGRIPLNGDRYEGCISAYISGLPEG